MPSNPCIGTLISDFNVETFRRYLVNDPAWPPVSATTALTVENRGVHGGIVISQTMMSPFRSLEPSDRVFTTLTVPCTTPADAPMP